MLEFYLLQDVDSIDTDFASSTTVHEVGIVPAFYPDSIEVFSPILKVCMTSEFYGLYLCIICI